MKLCNTIAAILLLACTRQTAHVAALGIDVAHDQLLLNGVMELARGGKTPSSAESSSSDGHVESKGSKKSKKSKKGAFSEKAHNLTKTGKSGKKGKKEYDDSHSGSGKSGKKGKKEEYSESHDETGVTTEKSKYSKHGKKGKKGEEGAIGANETGVSKKGKKSKEGKKKYESPSSGDGIADMDKKRSKKGKKGKKYEASKKPEKSKKPTTPPPEPTSTPIDTPAPTEGTTEPPTTEAPTTEAPTTEAPTTEAPTTEAPTTEAPTGSPVAVPLPVTPSPTAAANETAAPTGTPTISPVATDAPTQATIVTDSPTIGANETVSPTSGSPGEPFDISNCESYGLDWLVDLQNSCTDFTFATLEGCECPTAQALLDSGEITCAEEGDSSPPACPDDCGVCQTCLVLSGCPNIYGDDAVPPLPTTSSPPTDVTTNPTTNATTPATSAPFDISRCVSYGLDWLLELQDSCTDFATLEGCECPSAQALFDAGEISCAEEGDSSPPACPQDCGVCQTCMVSVLGCPDIYQGPLVPGTTTSPPPTNDTSDGTGDDTPTTDPVPFDISDCEAYGLDWLLELQNTCTDFTTLAGCECPSAQALFDAGEISCAENGEPSPPACPDDCGVCQTCLVSALGCPDIYGGSRNQIPALPGSLGGQRNLRSEQI